MGALTSALRNIGRAVLVENGYKIDRGAYSQGSARISPNFFRAYSAGEDIRVIMRTTVDHYVTVSPLREEDDSLTGKIREGIEDPSKTKFLFVATDDYHNPTKAEVMMLPFAPVVEMAEALLREKMELGNTFTEGYAFWIPVETVSGRPGLRSLAEWIVERPIPEDSLRAYRASRGGVSMEPMDRPRQPPVAAVVLTDGEAPNHDGRFTEVFQDAARNLRMELARRTGIPDTLIKVDITVGNMRV